jgi:hypothetical protein
MKKSHPAKKLCVSASLRELEKQKGKPVLVPKLRFPVFRGTEVWEENRIGNVCRLKAGDARVRQGKSPPLTKLN